MSRTPRTLALVAALAAALVLAPTAVADPAHGPADALGAVYDWLGGVWDSIVSITTERTDAMGPLAVPDGSDEYGPLVIPNGSQDELSGPMVIPNGQQSQAEDEFGGFIPNGGPDPSMNSEEDGGPEDEIGPLIIPNG